MGMPPLFFWPRRTLSEHSACRSSTLSGVPLMAYRLFTAGISTTLLALVLACNLESTLAVPDCENQFQISAVRTTPLSPRTRQVSGKGREHNATVRDVARVLSRRMANRPPEDWADFDVVIPQLDLSVAEVGERLGGYEKAEEFRQVMRLQVVATAETPELIGETKLQRFADSLRRMPNVQTQFERIRRHLHRLEQRQKRVFQPRPLIRRTRVFIRPRNLHAGQLLVEPRKFEPVLIVFRIDGDSIEPVLNGHLNCRLELRTDGLIFRIPLRDHVLQLDESKLYC